MLPGGRPAPRDIARRGAGGRRVRAVRPRPRRACSPTRASATTSARSARSRCRSTGCSLRTRDLNDRALTRGSPSSRSDPRESICRFARCPAATSRRWCSPSGSRPNRSVYLLDDPTRGVDVHTRAQMHQVIRGLADEGAIVLIASSDLDELCEVADRAVIFFRGRAVSRAPTERLARASPPGSHQHGRRRRPHSHRMKGICMSLHQRLSSSAHWRGSRRLPGDGRRAHRVRLELKLKHIRVELLFRRLGEYRKRGFGDPVRRHRDPGQRRDRARPERAGVHAGDPGRR